MLEVEFAGQRGSWMRPSEMANTATEDVAASEAFGRWLHHRYVPIELPSAGHIVSPRGISCVFHVRPICDFI